MLANKVLQIILDFEQASQLVSSKQLLATIVRAIDKGQINFIIFPCLAIERDQELAIDLFKTSFFNGGKKAISKSVRRIENMIEQISFLGLEANIITCLSDVEPNRVWGWQGDQEELTIACQLMSEQGRETLSSIWQTILWSDIERQYKGAISFQDVLDDLAKPGKHRLLIDAQEKHLLGTSHSHHCLSPREVASRRVASYGLEGLVLEQVIPEVIFMQVANPYKIRDHLHQRLRSKRNELPIIHPFNAR